ncbi:hypothetical protein [Sinomonas albida]|uniref:hypothetical protein n=1 Tax=Sinomonas albida TaxID=369942 RepID=UPI003017CD0A
MAKKKTEARHAFELPDELVRRRVEHAASGASGVHSDQKARRHRTGAVNRIGSRSSRTRAAIRNEGT